MTVTERDDEGRPAQWTVETDPEFDANERDSWYALWEYEQEVCPSCGNLRSVCSDPETPWYPQRTVCWATATRQLVGRKWNAKVGDTKHSTEKFHPDDGVSLWVASANLTPDDDFLD